MTKKIIFKHKLEIGNNEIVLPIESTILSAEIQNGIICLWYLRNKDDSNLTRTTKVNVIGTGFAFELGALYRHINTILFNDGSLVFHVIEDCS